MAFPLRITALRKFSLTLISASMSPSKLKLLLQLLSQPTAPFRESHVVHWAEKVLAQGGVPHFQDPHGNLVIGARSPTAYQALLRRTSHEPVRIFVAHMDHPGLVGSRWLAPTRLEATWLGGSPVKHISGARIWLANASGYLSDGSVESHHLAPSRRSLHTVVVRLKKSIDVATDPATIFGGFGFRSPAWRQGNYIMAKAADDLIGVFAICTLALDLFRGSKKLSRNFLGLLTRGEEVGFTGAIQHLDLGWTALASRPLVAISLETSRALPDAVIGKGPVVRLGDRRTVFDPGALRVLQQVAETVLPGNHQRRVMDGGACEATAAICWGMRAVGISVPLGNYHNECFGGISGSAGKRGDIEGAPAPEFVDLPDVDGLLDLCRGLMVTGLPWSDPWKPDRQILRKRIAHYRKYSHVPQPRTRRTAMTRKRTR